MRSASCHCRVGLASWLILVLGGIAGGATQAPADFPPPDEFHDAGRTYTYVAKARDFLRENPQAACAPRVAFNLLMIATVERNQPLGDEMHRRLIVEHTDSLYARYALAVWPDQQQFRQFLGRLAGEQWEAAGDRFSRAYCQAVRQGLDRWGPQLLGDESFLLTTTVLADTARDGYLRSLCSSRLQDSKNEKTRRVAGIVLDGGRDPADKVLRLHALEQDAAAARLERFFFSRLAAEERARPEILRASAESQLEAGKLAAALPLIREQAARQADPQLLFWLAWCCAAQGQKPQALSAVAELEKQWPQDPWTGDARQIAQHLHGLDERLEAYADGVLAVAERLRRPETDAFEGRLAYRCDDGREIHVYLGLVTSQGAFDLVIEEADRTVLAYQARDGQGKIYFDGEPAVHAFRQKAKYPLFATQLAPDGKQGIHFNWNFNFHDSPEAMAQSKQRINIAPELLTREAMAALLRQGLNGNGRFPAAVEADGGGTRYAWVRPLVRRPGFETVEYRVAADGTLTWFRCKSLTGSDLRFGSSRALRLSPPRWPDRPVVVREEMDPAAMFRAMAAVMSLMSPSPNATAQQGATPRR